MPDSIEEPILEMHQMFTIREFVKQRVWLSFHCFQTRCAIFGIVAVTSSEEVWGYFFTNM